MSAPRSARSPRDSWFDREDWGRLSNAAARLQLHPWGAVARKVATASGGIDAWHPTRRRLFDRERAAAQDCDRPSGPFPHPLPPLPCAAMGLVVEARPEAGALIQRKDGWGKGLKGSDSRMTWQPCGTCGSATRARSTERTTQALGRVLRPTSRGVQDASVATHTAHMFQLVPASSRCGTSRCCCRPVRQRPQGVMRVGR